MRLISPIPRSNSSPLTISACPSIHRPDTFPRAVAWGDLNHALLAYALRLARICGCVDIELPRVGSRSVRWFYCKPDRGPDTFATFAVGFEAQISLAVECGQSRCSFHYPGRRLSCLTPHLWGSKSFLQGHGNRDHHPSRSPCSARSSPIATSGGQGRAQTLPLGPSNCHRYASCCPRTR